VLGGCNWNGDLVGHSFPIRWRSAEAFHLLVVSPLQGQSPPV
jgi:hypothetical protein